MDVVYCRTVQDSIQLAMDNKQWVRVTDFHILL
jgi:hypothetical protein